MLCSQFTLKATRARMAHDLSILFNHLQLLELTLTGRKKLRKCQVCKRSIPGSEKKARVHVAEHFLAPTSWPCRALDHAYIRHLRR